MLACLKKGWITCLPNHTQVSEEFGYIGFKTTYYKYLKEEKYDKTDIDVAMNALKLE